MNYREPLSITTERLVLRPYGADDHEEMYDLVSRPETFRFAQREPMGREDSWARLLRHVGNWAALGYGLFAVRERQNGAFVGEVGLASFRREFEPPFECLPEATWSFLPQAQGRGYATEAAAAAQLWAEREAVITRSMCMIHPDNRSSIRVAEKLGFDEYARANHKGQLAILFRRLRSP